MSRLHEQLCPEIYDNWTPPKKRAKSKRADYGGPVFRRLKGERKTREFISEEEYWEIRDSEEKD